MNLEERKRKRQQDTKNAMVVLIVILVAVVLAVTGIIIAVNHFVLKDRPPKKQNQGTEQLQNTENSGDVTPPVVPAVDPLTQQAADFVSGMKLEDKIAQMFVLTPNALTGFEGVTAAGDTTKEFYEKRPVGGIIYMADNLLDKEQTKQMLANMTTIAKDRTGLPIFLSVDEEGGSVARIAGNTAFGIENVGDMSAIGATGDAGNAYTAGAAIGTYLKELGFNVDFAPVADVLTNPDNTAIGKRSFGSDSQVVADMVVSELQGLSSQGIYGTVKHYPGHGGTSADTHEGAATVEKTLEELKASELVPFQKAVDSGVSFIMAGHISLPDITGDNTPASLSQMMVTNILREQMGYEGIVITDGMNMAAITESYTPDQAAVMAVSAGVDMILMPQDYEKAYNGILAAVNDGTISEDRINQSVQRIVKVKLAMGQ